MTPTLDRCRVRVATGAVVVCAPVPHVPLFYLFGLLLLFVLFHPQQDQYGTSFWASSRDRNRDLPRACRRSRDPHDLRLRRRPRNTRTYPGICEL